MIHVAITNLIVSTLKVPFIHSLHSKFVQTWYNSFDFY